MSDKGMSDKREICGLFFGCPNEATVSVLSGIGGCFGKVCDDHADRLNGFLEDMMRINRRMADGESIPSGEIPRWRP